MKFTVETLPRRDGLTIPSWQEATGEFVFPLSWGEKLDKALDECQVVCYNSTVKRYKPNTPFRITANDGTNTKAFLYKLAKDTSKEYPVGSNTYKHTLYFVEITKYLEGVLCQSITFTNRLIPEYTDEKKAVTYAWGGGEYGHDHYLPTDKYDDWTTSLFVPVQQAGQLSLPSAHAVSTAFRQDNFKDINNSWLTEKIIYEEVFEPPVGSASWVENSHIDYIIDGEQHQTQTWDETVSSSTATSITATYYVNIKTTSYIGVFPTQQPNYFLKFSITVSTNPQEQTGESYKWTVATVIDRMFDLCEPIEISQKPRFSLDATQHAELNKILSPEFSSPISTLREQLQLVGGYINAEPRIVDVSWDEAREEYRYTIKFDYIGNTGLQTLNQAYFEKVVDFDLANYTTQLQTNVKNVVNSLSSDATITDPGFNSYKGLRAEQSNIRVSDSNAVVKTFCPIYDLKKVYCGIFKYSNNTTSILLSPQEITKYCYEATEYDSVLSSYSGAIPYSKACAIRWVRGENTISQMFYQAPHSIDTALSPYAIVSILHQENPTVSISDIENFLGQDGAQLVFQVVYVPITNTAFIHGKNEYANEEPYTTAYNQSDSLVEQSYYGQNIKGAVARMGNPEMQITAKFSTLGEMPKLGYRTVIDGEEYYITTINSQMDSQKILSTVGLSKDFNKLSEYVGINSRKRIEEISLSQSYDRDIIIHCKYILGTPPMYLGQNKLVLPYNPYQNVFKKLSYGDVGTVTQAVITRDEQKNAVCLPAIASACGNVTVLTTSMKDNYSAGESEHYLTSGAAKGFWQFDKRFGDDFGRAKTISIYFCSKVNNSSDFAWQYPTPDAQNKTRYAQAYMARYLCRKDSRERLSTISFNIELQSSLTGVYIGSAFSKFNSLVCGGDKRDNRIPHLYIIPNGDAYKIPYKFTEKITDMTGWYDEGEVWADDYDENGLAVTLWVYKNGTKQTLYSHEGKGFVIAFPVTTTTETVINENSQQVEQTIYQGGEVVLINANHIEYHGGMLGNAYTIYQE